MMVGVVLIAGASVAFGPPVQSPLMSSGIELLDCVLPLSEEGDPSVTWSIAVRGLPAFQSEWLVRLKRLSSGRLTAELHWPRSARIVDQYSGLAASSPSGISCDAARGALHTSELVIDSDEEPRLREFASQFEQLSLRTRLSNEFIFDATRYEVQIDGTQDHARLMIHEMPGSGAQMAHPLVDWAERLRMVIDKKRRKS